MPLLKVGFEKYKPTKKEVFMSSSHTWTKWEEVSPVAARSNQLPKSVVKCKHSA